MIKILQKYNKIYSTTYNEVFPFPISKSSFSCTNDSNEQLIQGKTFDGHCNFMAKYVKNSFYIINKIKQENSQNTIICIA